MAFLVWLPRPADTWYPSPVKADTSPWRRKTTMKPPSCSICASALAMCPLNEFCRVRALSYLYQALCALAARKAEHLDAAAVIVHAREGRDPQCATALDLFFNFLGSVAGDLALTLGARGGVYVGGGIVPRLIPELESSSFRDRFESKGRFRDYLRDIPTFVINTKVSPAFLWERRVHWTWTENSKPGVGSKSAQRVWCLVTICGSKLPWRSRGFL